MAPVQRAAAPSPEPPFYEATEDIYVGGEAGTMPVAAYRKGDKVLPAAVRKNKWEGKVQVPEQFRVQAAPAAASSAADKEQ